MDGDSPVIGWGVPEEWGEVIGRTVSRFSLQEAIYGLLLS